MLKGLRIDTLKIDRSFISDLASDPESSAITATIINMGHDLGMTVVAEGVETQQQLEILRTMGCDELQGYLFSRPVSGDDFTALVLNEDTAGQNAEPEGAPPNRVVAHVDPQ